MLEAAIGTTVPIPNVSRETLVDRNQIFPSMTTGAGLQTLAGNITGLKGSTQNLADAINFGTGFPDEISARRVDDPRFIDFGVVDRRAPGTGVSTVGDDFAPALDMVDARTQEASIVGDDFQPALDMVDARTTATGTTGGEDPFDPDVGRAFPVETLERAERLANEKTALERLGLPSFLSAVDPERVSRDLMATSLIAGRPIRGVEAIRGVQAPNIGMGPIKATDKETIEEFNKRTGARIPESQIITDDGGLVVGIKDAQGNLVTGMDPNAQEVQGDNDNIARTKAPPKSPTDPCPEGYQLIDGKCTPVETEDKGTGFITFPPDRDPPFRTGPFTPKTIATNPIDVRPMVPLTFGLSNIFRR